jgi:hypothetical protein
VTSQCPKDTGETDERGTVAYNWEREYKSVNKINIMSKGKTVQLINLNKI